MGRRGRWWTRAGRRRGRRGTRRGSCASPPSTPSLRRRSSRRRVVRIGALERAGRKGRSRSICVAGGGSGGPTQSARRRAARRVVRRPRPAPARRRPRGSGRSAPSVARGDAEVVGDATRPRRTDAFEQPEHAVPRQFVGGVVEDAQQGERVLDVRRLEELEPAELHERDVAAAELDLEPVAVMAGAEQHRLVVQRHAQLALLDARRRRRRWPGSPRRRSESASGGGRRCDRSTACAGRPAGARSSMALAASRIGGIER